MPTEIKTPFNRALRAKTCAAQLFGSWHVEPKWFAQAIEAIRSGKLKPATPKSEDDDDDAKEKKRPPLTVAELDDDYAEDEEKGYKVVRTNGKSIAVICIEGTMLKYRSSFGGCSTVEVRRAVRAASNDRMVDAIMLYVDSPGGSCAGTSDLAADVVEAGKRRPLYAFIANMGASAAYWVSSQAQAVWANEIAMVGSIGTYCVLEDDTKAQEEIGVKLTVVSTGPFKGLGADGKVTEQLISDVQREIDDLNERFLVAVAAGRAMAMDRVRALADGRVHVGEKAVQEGLVDVVGTFDAALQALSQEKPKMITRDQFNAYAAEHPDAAKVFTDKGIEEGYAQAKKDLTAKPANVAQLKESFPGQDTFVLAQLEAGATMEQANAAAVKSLRTELASAGTKHAEALAAKDSVIAEKDAEIKRLNFTLTDTKGVTTTTAKKDEPKGAVASEIEKIEDPKERAKAEWAADTNGCKADFVSEAAYVGYRAAALRGGVTIHKPGSAA